MEYDQGTRSSQNPRHQKHWRHQPVGITTPVLRERIHYFTTWIPEQVLYLDVLVFFEFVERSTVNGQRCSPIIVILVLVHSVRHYVFFPRNLGSEPRNMFRRMVYVAQKEDAEVVL